jgi:hypothetical protein
MLLQCGALRHGLAPTTACRRTQAQVGTSVNPYISCYGHLSSAVASSHPDLHTGDSAASRIKKASC